MRPEAMKQVSLSDNIDCFASLSAKSHMCVHVFSVYVLESYSCFGT